LNNVLSSDALNPTISIRNALTIVKDGVPYFHVINTNAGFVIFSSDSLYDPILAYDSSNNFSFDSKDLNIGISMWLEKHAYQLDFVRNNRGIVIDSIGKNNKLLWRALGASLSAESNQQSLTNTATRPNPVGVQMLPPTLISSVPVSYSVASNIGPLCTTLWGQTPPWNQFCPSDPATSGTINGGHDPAGCVPVAMAQLMYFWQFSNKGYNFNSMVRAIITSDPSTYPANNPAGFTGSARMMSDIGLTPGTFWTNVAHGFTSSKFASYSSNGTECDMEYCI
jgi:hypothetical protein